MKAVLIREGREKGETQIPLSGSRLQIGRNHADIPLAHTSVSREHAVLQCRPEGWVLSDQDSRNGTRVNGVAIVRRLLRDGDRIRLGALELIYREVDDDSPLLQMEAVVPEEDDISESATGYLPHAPPTGFMERVSDAFLLAALKRFAETASGREGLDLTLRLIVEDLHGIRGIHRVVLHVPEPGPDGKGRWMRAGATRARPGVVYPEERMLACAKNGREVTISGGREKEIVSGASCDAVCVALCVGSSAGFLYVEGEDELDVAVPDMVRATSEGIGLGLAIWRNASSHRVERASAANSPLLVGRSEALQKAVRMALRAAAADSTVLLRGESGTGKELFARLIYVESPRRDAPFVPVHCSAIEETLMGSALFGHEKGAFTGAVGLKKGLFETANNGTIFLDEIGELGQDMQVKLLRILQEGEFMRVGGTQPIKVDVRVIAATNRDLEKAMREGAFREDLYYRLKVIQLDLPPLRERRDDIPDLVRHFMADIGASLPRRISRISNSAMDALKNHSWPGNVRELRNIVERSLVLSEGDEIVVDDLPLEWQTGQTPMTPTSASLQSVQRQHIVHMLAECGGNKRLAAQRLGISRSTLYEKLKESEGIAEGLL